MREGRRGWGARGWETVVREEKGISGYPNRPGTSGYYLWPLGLSRPGRLLRAISALVYTSSETKPTYAQSQVAKRRLLQCYGGDASTGRGHGITGTALQRRKLRSQ